MEDVAIYGEVETYTKGDYWARKSNTPDRKFIFSPSFQIGQKAYVFTHNRTGGEIQELWEYDSLLDRWTYKLSSPNESRFKAAGFAINGKGYIAYGEGGTNGPHEDMLEYDPNDMSNGLDTNGNPAGSFTLKEIPQPGGQKEKATAISIDNRVFYGWGVIFSPKVIHYKDFWEYLPNDLSNGYDANGNPNGAWERKADFPGDARYGVGAIGYNGKIYQFFGASEGWNSKAKEVYAYDIESDNWTKKTSAPGNNRVSPVVFLSKNKIYAGFGSGGHSIEFWSFDPEDTSNGFDSDNNPLGTWREVSGFAGGPRDAPGYFQIDNKAYLVGGEDPDSDDYFTETWEYVADEF